MEEVRFKDIYGDMSGQVYAGDFVCFNNNLTSLEGAPKVVQGDFYCSSNNLTSLEGVPEMVNGEFYCYNNELTSVKCLPWAKKKLFRILIMKQ